MPANLPGLKVKMDPVRIHMRDLTDIQPEPLEQDLGVENEFARAQLVTRVTRFFENKDTGREMRIVPCYMKSGGEPAGPSADDKNVFFRHDS